MTDKVTCKRLRPNPIFEDWLAKMYEDARLTNSRLVDKLKEALDSLMKYPLPLKSGAECIILKGFDKKLCTYLDKLLNDLNNHKLSEKDQSSCEEVISNGSENSVLKTPPSSSKNQITGKQGYSLSLDGRPGVDLDKLPQLAMHPVTECHVSLQHMDIDQIQYINPGPSGLTNGTGQGKVKAKGVGKKSGKYKPAHRSGGYAILVALLEQSLENPDKSALSKEELIEKAQKHSEESMVRPKNDSFYTAWSSIVTLQKMNLVTKINKKKSKSTVKVEYKLTEEGKRLALEIIEDAENIPTVNDIIFKDVPSSSTASEAQDAVMAQDNEVPSTSVANIIPSTSVANVIPSTSVTNVIPSTSVADIMPSTSGNISSKNVIELAPGTFDIIMLIDKNETGGLRKKNDPTVAQFNKYPDLKHEYRSLKVGDFVWIAKHKVNHDQELVLPIIVERKRMDDLAASIKDGRFHEQKFRLHKCGLGMVMYMVENYGKNKHVGLPLQHLMQAIANTRVQDGFQVYITDSLTYSVRFLAIMTKRLTIKYKDKYLRGSDSEPQGSMMMTFDYFNKSSAKSKPLTVTDTFIKLLLQLKGMSVDKALAITEKYPTPRSLINAYVKCDRREGETLLANLKYGELHRNVGPATSKSIYQLFSSGGAE
ncbi:hypothetical protein PYW07_003397 [Mythimna separata]|uniref:Crossover junction endonuclease MUS81 n=1 Tax=Mythimna separata TaxID=271217 RepID=A0AAD8DRY0_MYTSE|nr:hypothetical protein PYW07_003397 [Mythimna separata]